MRKIAEEIYAIHVWSGVCPAVLRSVFRVPRRNAFFGASCTLCSGPCDHTPHACSARWCLQQQAAPSTMKATQEHFIWTLVRTQSKAQTISDWVSEEARPASNTCLALFESGRIRRATHLRSGEAISHSSRGQESQFFVPSSTKRSALDSFISQFAPWWWWNLFSWMSLCHRNGQAFCTSQFQQCAVPPCDRNSMKLFPGIVRVARKKSSGVHSCSSPAAVSHFYFFENWHFIDLSLNVHAAQVKKNTSRRIIEMGILSPMQNLRHNLKSALDPWHIWQRDQWNKSPRVK